VRWQQNLTPSCQSIIPSAMNDVVCPWSLNMYVHLCAFQLLKISSEIRTAKDATIFGSDNPECQRKDNQQWDQRKQYCHVPIWWHASIFWQR
jgi:hypothetical protein